MNKTAIFVVVDGEGGGAARTFPFEN